MIRQIIILIFFVTYSLTICGQMNNENKEIDSVSSLTYSDTSKIAVFRFDKTQHEWLFKDCIPADLSDTNLLVIEDILTQCVEDYNKNQRKHDKIGDLQGYKRQYIAVTNPKGEKEVWINCFCHNDGNNWRTQLVLVLGWGNCYFNLKINLSKKQYYSLAVNGPK